MGLSYLRKLIWPAGLSPAYETHLLTAPTFQMWLCVVVIVCGAGALVWIARKHWLVGISAAIVVLPLLPVLYGMRFFATPELVQDRYLYLPSVGMCLLVGLIVKYLWEPPKKRNLSVIGGLLFGSTYLWLLFLQEGYYADCEQLDLRVLELQPNRVDVMNGLAIGYYLAGRADLALVEFSRAEQLVPNNPLSDEGIYFVKHNLPVRAPEGDDVKLYLPRE